MSSGVAVFYFPFLHPWSCSDGPRAVFVCLGVFILRPAESSIRLPFFLRADRKSVLLRKKLLSNRKHHNTESLLCALAGLIALAG